ncbi:hypothetical protein Q1695_004953 [Nippostrongylus brasiliensis]|nr:hypothetical protein Q1695_004953 [Nippostrongylus brasiliensis]
MKASDRGLLLVAGCLAFALIWAFIVLDGYTTTLIYASDISDTVVDPFEECILPHFDPWNEQIVPFVNLDSNPLKNCNRTFKVITKLRNNVLYSTEKNVNCSGRCLNRKSENINDIGPWIPINSAVFACDVVESTCDDQNGNNIERMIHAQIVERTDDDREKKRDSHIYYDVYVILLDSTSASQAIRNLPKTMHFFEKSMDAVSFPHVNKVGLNSHPNAIALFFGKTMERLDRTMFDIPSREPDWDYNKACFRYLDNDTFLLKEFSEKGYKTLLAEDWMNGALNWPNCYGFAEQPTDHYMRPFQIAIEREPSKLLTKTYSSKNCIEQHQDILRYLGQFVNSYKDKPKFAWLWLSLLGHDDESGLIHADSDFLRFFLDNKKKLDESFVVILGDHGLRFGEVTRTELGNLDVNNPAFTISIPRRLRTTTNILSALRANAVLLQTMYDVRATLLDILKHQPALNFTDRSPMIFEGEYGASLLRSQENVKKSCKHLPIPVEYCICTYEMEDLESSTQLANETGNFIVWHINSALRKNNVSHLCEHLKHDRTLKISSFKGNKVGKMYSVTIRVKPPSMGEFKALVRRTDGGDFEMVSAKVSRVNRFGNTGACMSSALRSLCHCKKQGKS